MKLEQQVCSLELAKKLKDLGVKQESLFYWLDYGDDKFNIVADSSFKVCDNSYSAFTVAELGEMLPKQLGGTYGGTQITCCVNEDDYECSYYSFYNDKTASQLKEMEHMSNLAKTEADARAKMLIYLLENNLI